MKKETITITKYHLLIIFLIICLIFSTILSLIPISELCIPGNGCDVVHNSKYSELLGRKNSDYGIIAFSIMIILSFLQINKPKKQTKQFIYLGIIIGSIISVYFLYLQQFVIKAYCKYCLVVDISMLICLAILIFNWKK